MRKNVSAVKAIMPIILHDIAERALHLHGALGVTTQVPFTDALINSYHVGPADGPTEVHKMVVAREVLKEYRAIDALFPGYMLYKEEARALALYGDELRAVAA